MSDSPDHPSTASSSSSADFTATTSDFYTCSQISTLSDTLTHSMANALQHSHSLTHAYSLPSRALRIPVHVEVEIDPRCTRSTAEVAQAVRAVLSDKCPLFTNGSLAHLLSSTVSLPNNTATDVPLSSLVRSLVVCDIDDRAHKKVSFWQADLSLSLFRASEQGPESDYLEGESELPVAEQWELPNALLRGLWESIVLESAVKLRLLNYCATSLHFAECGVDSNVISWNKMLLLYGPPGTGKTSLCKALAHKVAIAQLGREPTHTPHTTHTTAPSSSSLNATTHAQAQAENKKIDRPIVQKERNAFESSLLFEVNCHSLFSKWFSESGKLVMRLFTHINEVAEDPQCLVFLLIDEVESIASARTTASSSGEPSDAIRVVNAVLTSLDALKRKKNVLVMCTSNMISSLDEAFLDRLDLKIFLGNPGIAARYQILHSCLTELCSKGVIIADETFDTNTLVQLDMAAVATTQLPDLSAMSVRELKELYGEELSRLPDHTSQGTMLPHKLLVLLALKTENMSGRTLRKLPIRAHSLFVHRENVTARYFLLAMLAALESNEPN